jgi:hypothetical protein
MLQLTLHSDPPLTKFPLDLKEKNNWSTSSYQLDSINKNRSKKIIWWGPKGWPTFPDCLQQFDIKHVYYFIHWNVNQQPSRANNIIKSHLLKWLSIYLNCQIFPKHNPESLFTQNVSFPLISRIFKFKIILIFNWHLVIVNSCGV